MYALRPGRNETAGVAYGRFEDRINQTGWSFLWVRTSPRFADEVQMHVDAVKPGQSVLMVDDLIATGGTMRAACDLVTQCGARILGVAVLIELTGLGGRDLLEPFDIHAQLTY